MGKFLKKGDNMEIKEIWLEEEIEKDLGERNKMEDLFNMLNKSPAKKVIMNFENINFMSRSVAQEYLNQKKNANFEVEEKNIPHEINEMMEIIIQQNK